MSKFGGWAAALLLVGATADLAMQRAPAISAAERATQERLLRDVDDLRRDVSHLRGRPGKQAFERARLDYKQVEGLVERIAPGTATTLNGPAEPRANDDAPSLVIQPEGFQVVEQLLYGPDSSANAQSDSLQRELRALEANVVRVRRLIEANHLDAVNIFAAAREEIARVATLGIVDFDSPLAGRGAVESAAALRGTMTALAPFDAILGRRAPAVAATLRAAGQRAATALENPRLDRLRFIADDARTLATAVMAAADALGVPGAGEHTLWREDVPSPFDAGAFDPDALAPRANRNASPARIRLGQALFADPVLSGNGRRSCSTCHLLARAFADTTRGSPGVDGKTPLIRNTPSLINVALQPALFADARTAYLEDQIAQVIASQREMGGSLDTSARRLNVMPGYRAAFRRAFGDSTATPDRIRSAIAAYLRTLVALDAPIDRAMRGDTTALTPSERAGFEVFIGRGKCATCHFLPLLNGTVPPRFTEVESEIIGVPDRWPHPASVDQDPGIGGRTRAALDRLRFRTPSLRGVALTAPYMHNGVLPTLDAVVQFYDAGGGAGFGIQGRQTLARDSLRLTAVERDALIAFLRSLAGSPHAPAASGSRLDAASSMTRR